MKKIKLLQRPRSVLSVWIAAYLCVLIVPLGANILIGNISLRGINEEIENYNAAYLSKIAADVDNVLIENMRLTERTEASAELKELATFGENLDIVAYRKIYNFLESHSDIFSQNMKIYLKKSKCMLSYDSMSQGMISYTENMFDASLSYDEWYRIVTNSYNHEYMMLGDSLYEIHTIFEGTSSEANLFMQVEKSYFKWSVDNKLFPKNVNVVIKSADGGLVYTTDRNITLASFVCTGTKGTEPFKVNGISNMVSWQNSGVANWTYLMVIPHERFYARAENIYTLSIVIFLLSMMVSVAGLIILTRQNYKPIRRMLDKLGIDARVNEYDHIARSVNSISYRYNDMSRQKLVSQLLGSSMQLSPNAKILEDYGITVKGKAVAVVVVVEEVTELFSDEKSNMTDFDVIGHAIKNVFSEIAERYGFGAYFSANGGEIGVLIDVRGEISVTDLLLKIDELLINLIGIKTTIACGPIVDKLDEIYRSYTTARQVYFLMRFVGETGVGNYNAEICRTHCLDEKRLNTLKLSVLEQGSDLWHSIICELFSFGIDKPKRSDMEIVLYDISRMLVEISRDRNVDKDMEQNKIKNLAGAESLDEFCSEMEEMVNEIRTNADDADELDNIIKVKQFVAEHYTDSNLSNRMIAESTGVSVNYISKYFKEQTGEGLLNYITRLRVSKAKELLASTDKIIQDVATEVGFYNALALIRAYKKIEGITPTQYRKLKNGWE